MKPLPLAMFSRSFLGVSWAAFVLTANVALAQHSPRLALRATRGDSEETKRFVATCLCTRPVNDLLRGYPYADTVRQLTAFITLEPALQLPGACNGIYYFYLRSPYWKTPTFRGGIYTYNYLVILNQQLTVFAGQDPANRRKYRTIRKSLIQAIGKPKTDSLKRELLIGYRQLGE